MPPKTIREEVVAGKTLRLASDGKQFLGVVISGQFRTEPLIGDDAEEVWRRLRNEIGKASPNYFGYDGAKARFLSIMTQGFDSELYLKGERDYKVRAKELLEQTLPLTGALEANADDAREVARVFGRTNLLSPFESARVGEVLRGVAGPAFVRASASFALGEVSSGLTAMKEILKAHGQPSWPIVTYLPFLWSSGEHMFLKPTVTTDYAERVGHPFSYEYSAQLEARVYASLLELVEQTESEIADLKPTDRVDIQSFIWVVGRWSQKDADVSEGAPVSG